MKKIIFRADGNSETGLGHLYRLFSLVEIVKEHYDFIFLTKQTSTLAVIPEDYNVSTIPEHIIITEEPQWIKSNFSYESHFIIADGYHFDSTYQYDIKQFKFSLIYVDDLAKDIMFADLVINHSPYLKLEDYDKQAYTQLALGTSYALLRPAFLEAARQKRQIGKIDSAFVCFGGADPFNLTLKALKGLLLRKDIQHIHVVLGAAYKHSEIFEISDTFKDKEVLIHKNLSELQLVKIMKACQFAIAPASTILYELCCIKMPILSGYYVDNQKLIYNGFLNQDAIYGGGNMQHYNTKDFSNEIESILSLKTHVNTIESQGTLFDGEIKTRLLNLINSI